MGLGEDMYRVMNRDLAVASAELTPGMQQSNGGGMKNVIRFFVIFQSLYF